MIYSVHNATTPLLPQVIEVMNDAAEKFWGILLLRTALAVKLLPNLNGQEKDWLP